MAWDWRPFCRRTFPLFERIGLHVVPNRYDQPIPDTRTLGESLFTRRSSLPGVALRAEKQLALLAELSARWRVEYERFPLGPTGVPHAYFVDNTLFESVDGEVYWSLLRRHRPRRVVEIGSGVSTYLAAEALLRNEADGAPPAELVAIEPYPNATLAAGFPGLSHLVRERVQDVPLELFLSLAADDVLFIDSSHVLAVGSDVAYEVLEILPRLSPGVLVHVHDVFLPAEYPRRWVMEEMKFWNEQHVLQAFLAFNRAYEVLFAASYLHLEHPDALEAAFPTYRRDRRWPGSFWIRRVKEPDEAADRRG